MGLNPAQPCGVCVAAAAAAAEGELFRHAPGEWPTRWVCGVGGLMVSDVLQIGCEQLAHTSQELSRSYTAVTVESRRPPQPQVVAAAATADRHICC